METIQDESFGVVPVVKEAGEWKVLLVHQISYRGANDRFWTFPKGHQEADESPYETAKRELLEETGVQHVSIIKEAAFSIKYSFMHEEKRIEKTVTYFLGVCKDTVTSITLPHEIADLAWVSFKDAATQLSHKNAQSVLLQAAQYIQKHAL